MTRSDYEDRQAARKERLLERAGNADRKAESAEQAASARASGIPMGQPILVGHHSERRHRRDLERIDRGHRTAHAERSKAANLRSRAASVGTGGVSSDDPSAMEKLDEKLRALNERREQMKAVNAAWRKAKKPAPDSVDGWKAVATTLGVELEALQELRLDMARLGALRNAPYPAYALQNTGAEVRRLNARIEELRAAEAAEAVDEDHGICRLVESPDENRVQLIFDGKPPADTRALLKQNGFRWSPSVGAWQRHLNSAGRAAARAVLSQLSKEVL